MKFLAVDTETHLIPPLGTKKVQLRHLVPQMVCAQVHNDEVSEVLMAHEPADMSRLLGLITSPDTTFIMHNAAFDIAVLSSLGESYRQAMLRAIREHRILDTRVMYLMRDPDPINKAISLTFLAKRMLGYTMLGKGATQLSYKYGEKLDQEQYRYALDDAKVTWNVAQALMARPMGSLGYGKYSKLIAARQNGELIAPDYVYSKAAAHMAWPISISIDQEELKARHQELTLQVNEVKDRLLKQGGAIFVRVPKVQPEPAAFEVLGATRTWSYSPELGKMVRLWKGEQQQIDCKFKTNQSGLCQVAEEYGEKYDLNLPRTEKTKKVSLKKDDWSDFENLPPVLDTFMEYQKYSKYLSTYTAPLVESGAQEVFPRYFVPGAATGRWACSKPNLQNVPKGSKNRTSLRAIYAPKKGHVFLEADYSTLELYTLAQTMYDMGIDGPLRATLNAGKDIHQETADMVGCSRQDAKACNFGLPGGMGPRMFAKMYGYTFEAAKKLKNDWLTHFWDVRQYLKAFSTSAWTFYRGDGTRDDRDKWLSSLGFTDQDIDKGLKSFDIIKKLDEGRIFTCKLSSGRIIPRRRYSMASNCFFQGLGADIITRAFNTLRDEGWHVAVVVHDSLTLEVKDNRGAISMGSAALDRAMSNAQSEVCPDIGLPSVDVEVLERWK